MEVPNASLGKSAFTEELPFIFTSRLVMVDTEIHVMTNLAKRVSATSIANLYRDRSHIVTALTQRSPKTWKEKSKRLATPKQRCLDSVWH